MRKAKIMHKSGTILHTIPVVSHKPHILCILRGRTADLLLEHAPEIAVLRKAAGLGDLADAPVRLPHHGRGLLQAEMGEILRKVDARLAFEAADQQRLAVMELLGHNADGDLLRIVLLHIGHDLPHRLALALLRRQGAQVNQLTLGNTSLDLSTAALSCGADSIRLSAREFDIMRLLLQAGERNLSKAALLERVWGYDSDAVENHVEVYVCFLRKKLASIGSNIRIESIRRLGYHLEVSGDD